MITSKEINPFDDLSCYYKGFYITNPVGNNSFSYQERQNKKIYVAPLFQGDLEYLREGEEVAFSEIHEDIELNVRGLKRFLYFNKFGKDIFIFDNHNHAFFFWLWAVKHGRIPPGRSLVHVDQHKDLREPERPLSAELGPSMDLNQVFEYTNFVLNVGNFIKPALDLGIFSRVEFIDHKDAFYQNFTDGFVLDLDMDIFAKVMKYIDNDVKIAEIRNWIQQASFVTIATSPFFMDQEEAVDLIQELFAPKSQPQESTFLL